MFEKAFVCVVSFLIRTAGARLPEAMTLGSVCPPFSTDTGTVVTGIWYLCLGKEFMEGSVTLIRIDVSLTSSLRYLGTGSSSPWPSAGGATAFLTGRVQAMCPAVSLLILAGIRLGERPLSIPVNEEAEVQNDPFVKGGGLGLCVFCC